MQMDWIGSNVVFPTFFQSKKWHDFVHLENKILGGPYLISPARNDVVLRRQSHRRRSANRSNNTSSLETINLDFRAKIEVKND